MPPFLVEAAGLVWHSDSRQNLRGECYGGSGNHKISLWLCLKRCTPTSRRSTRVIRPYLSRLLIFTELKEDIALVDARVMGLAKRIDQVEERLSREIAEVRTELVDHRNNSEMHRVAPKRSMLKIVA